jgi:hypothetical protein
VIISSTSSRLSEKSARSGSSTSDMRSNRLTSMGKKAAIVILSLLGVLLLGTGAYIIHGAGGYAAVLRLRVDASQRTLAGNWVSPTGATVFELSADSSFTVAGFRQCFGDVEVVLPGNQFGTRLTLDSGAGTWQVTTDTNNPGVDNFLLMRFRSPRAFTLRFQAHNVRWQTDSRHMLLVSDDTAGITDGTATRCDMESR